MKKSSQSGHVSGTAKNQNESPVINDISLSNRLTVSDTERGVFRRMNECTPANELLLRG